MWILVLNLLSPKSDQRDEFSLNNTNTSPREKVRRIVDLVMIPSNVGVYLCKQFWRFFEIVRCLVR